MLTATLVTFLLAQAAEKPKLAILDFTTAGGAYRLLRGDSVAKWEPVPGVIEGLSAFGSKVSSPLREARLVESRGELYVSTVSGAVLRLSASGASCPAD